MITREEEEPKLATWKGSRGATLTRLLRGVRARESQAEQQGNSPHPSPGFLWARPSKKKQ